MIAKRKLKILFLTYQGDMAGSTNSIIYLSQGLADLGHDVWMGCRKESLLFRTLTNSKVKLIPMTFKNKIDIKCIRKIAEIVKTHNIEIINAQSSRDRYLSIFARFFYGLKVKLVHTRRQVPLSAGGKLHQWFYEKSTDKIVVISKALQDVFVKKGYHKSHLKVIHNGTPSSRYQQIDWQKIEAVRKRLGIKKDETIIGCISRPKNQIQLLHALPYLGNIRLLFVGIPPGYYTEESRRLGVEEKVIYGGEVDPDEILNYYKLLDVNVLASTMDGFGLVLVEAMALEVPVVATNYAGIKDVVQDGFNGLLFEDGDIEGLADKINQLLTNQNLRDKLVANGKKTALEEFSIEHTIRKYDLFFNELTAQ